MKQVFKKCDGCNGNGYVEVTDFSSYSSAGFDKNLEQCRNCNGTGFAETDLFIYEESDVIKCPKT